MDHRPIGMFDSGIGGINVYKEVKKQLPNESIIYLGDTKRFPYGNKSKEEIIQISRENIEFLIKKHVKCVIIACGTATSQALEVVSHEFDIPIIGIIEPTVKYVAQKMKDTKRLGVIATQGSIRSKQWEKSLKEKLNGIEIINEATPLLANIAEEGKIDKEETKKTIHEYMRVFHKIDGLILGCTHYPLFRKYIELELESCVKIIDIGVSVAWYLKHFFEKNGMQNETKEKKKDYIYLTSIEEDLTQYARLLLNSDAIRSRFCEEVVGEKIVFVVEL